MVWNNELDKKVKNNKLQRTVWRDFTVRATPRALTLWEKRESCEVNGVKVKTQMTECKALDIKLGLLLNYIKCQA